MSEKPLITYEDFSRLDIRIGTVTSAEKIPETDKLIKFTVNLGDETRQIVGGFAVSYPDPMILVGKQVPIVCNLEPRVIRGLESQGMLLAASNTDNGPVALHPDTDVEPGTVVR